MRSEQISDTGVPELAEKAWKILRENVTAVICTNSLSKPGWPFASLVSYGLSRRGEPLFLLSELSQHTRNLRADARASLFIQGAASRNPQAAPRISLLGTVAPNPAAEAPEAAALYVAGHPEGKSIAELGGFSFWHMKVEGVHVVAGFARAGWLSAAEFAVGKADRASQLQISLDQRRKGRH
jgi:putative heme iron utilization protein